MDTAGAGPELELRTKRGAMLYDASCIDQPGDELFDPGHWLALGGLDERPGGRGTVAFVRSGAGRWVLRHFRRGGAVARLLGDRYLFTGEERTRSFSEFRLLRRLRDLELPVPRAVAARYVRCGPWYRADLLTEELPSRLTLAQAIDSAPLAEPTWRDVGRAVGRLHVAGVRHADLNAHNVVLGPAREIYVLDFDRGRLAGRGAWERRVLDRLRRSLEKVSAGLPPGRFGESEWRVLLQGVDECAPSTSS